MKTTNSIIISIACIHALFLTGCQKPVEVVQYPVSETPTPPPIPTPTASIAPIPRAVHTPSATPTPQSRIAPDGELYVLTAFSLTTESGIHGFSKGKKVKIVREEGNQWVVSDGIAEAKAPKTSFTNNIDIAESLIAKDATSQKASAHTASQAISANAATDADLHKQRQQSVLKTKIQNAKEAVAAIDFQIKALNDEIQSLRSKYGSYNSQTGWSMKKSWDSSPTKQRDEQLIESMKIKQAAVRSEISQAEAELRKIP